jgi:hypothetical protein
MNCRVCNEKSGKSCFQGVIFGIPVDYFDCKFCSYMQTQTPTWLDKAYESTIDITDTGIMQRNLQNVNLVISSLLAMNKLHGTVLDYSGGYGFLVRMLRDQGIDAYWTDLYTENLVARGFEHNPGMSIDLITAFEAFEHYEYPTKEMENLFNISPNLLFSTTLIPNPTPKPGDWWYYGLNHGQHIGFFRVRTLKYLAKKYNKHLITDGHSLHIMTEKRISNTKWKIISKFQRIVHYMLRKTLTSKTWSDSINLANQQGKDSQINYP